MTTEKWAVKEKRCLHLIIYPFHGDLLKWKMKQVLADGMLRKHRNSGNIATWKKHKVNMKMKTCEKPISERRLLVDHPRNVQ